MPQAVGRGGQNVRLASELTGWSINVLSENEFASRIQSVQDAQEKALAESLELDERIANELYAAGYTGAEAVAYAEREELLAIEAFDENTVDALMERAADYLLAQAFVAESDPETEMQLSLDNIDSITPDLVELLQEKGLTTREDVAELAVDELIGYTGLDKEQASALILNAREPWFR